MSMNFRNVTRGAGTLTGALVVLSLLAGTALAYLTTTGGGSGQAATASFGAPVNVQPTGSTNNSVSLDWDAPSGVQPTSYTVTADDANVPSCSVTTATQCTATGLASSRTYSFIVTSRIDDSWSAAASPVNGTTLTPAPVVPAPSVSISTPATNTVTTTTPVITGTAINAATVTVTINGTPARTGTVDASSGSWTYAPAALTAGAAYTVTATAFGPGGSATDGPRPFTTDGTGPTNSFALESATGAFWSGTTLYYKSNAAGGFILVNSMTDAGSGPASTTFPGMTSTGWTHGNQVVSTPTGGPYKSSAYNWTSGPASPTAAERTITGRDVAGNTTPSVLPFTADITAPSGGSVAGTIGSTGTTVSMTITAPTDAGSGLKAGSVTYQRQRGNRASNGSCPNNSSWDAATTVTLAGSQDSITRGNCYRYRISGSVDNVGNTFTVGGSSGWGSELSVAP